MGLHRLSRPAFLLILIFLVNSALATTPKWHIKKDFPDFDQHTPSLGQGGNYHCSPTSAANSLTWFDKKLGLDIVPDGWTDTPSNPNNHVGLINQLGQECQTNGANGTGQPGGEYNGTWNDNYVRGLRNYLSNPAYNKSGKDFDVKFQGTKYFNGYTVGSMGATVQQSWLKSESADDEDVSLTIDWWLKNSAGQLVGKDTAGNYVVGGGQPFGAHTISMRGYTGYGRDSLFIKDPGTHELIVDRDKNYPNRLVYNYNTPQAPTGMTWVAEIVAAVSVSPKDRLVTEGIVDIFEYDNPPVVITPSPLADPYWTDYIDYVSIGIDSHGILDPLDPGMGHIGNIEIMDPATMNGYLLTYDDTGLTEIIHVDDGVPTPYIDDEFMFKLATAFAPSEMNPDPHVQTELFLNREIFGNLEVDSPFVFRSWTSMAPEMELAFEGIITPQSLGFEGPGEEPFAIPWTGDETVTLPFEVLPEPDPAEIAEMEFWENFVPIPGDLNEDGYVGSADLDTVRSHWGEYVMPGDTYAGDANGDGYVGSGDLDTVRSHWGESLEFGGIVPEPGAGLLLLLGLAMTAPRRRR